MQTTTLIMVNVQALDRLIEKFTLDNLAGCNDNPVMIELVDKLHGLIHDNLMSDQEVTCIRELPDTFMQLRLNTNIEDNPVDLITSLDLFGCGLLTTDQHNADRIRNDLYAQHIPLLSENAHRIIAHEAMAHAVSGALIGPIATASRYDDLSRTGYSVPPSSATATIDKAYLTMATEALHTFDMLVMQHVYLVNSVAEFETIDDED